MLFTKKIYFSIFYKFYHIKKEINDIFIVKTKNTKQEKWKCKSNKNIIKYKNKLKITVV